MPSSLLKKLILVSLLLTNTSLFAQTNDNSSSKLNTQSFGIPVYVDQIGLEMLGSRANQIGDVNPETYILSPSDVISFQFEGNFSMLIKSAVINSQGDITIPQVGIIKLSGLTITQALVELKSIAKKRFVKTDVSFLTLDNARPINVIVNGNLENPTTISLPGLSRLNTIISQIIYSREVKDTKDLVQGTNSSADFSLFSDKNQLFESTLRTPTFITEKYEVNKINTGDFELRNISIKQINGETRQFDFIRFLKTGELSENPVLLNGDVIQLGTISSKNDRASISGAVNSKGEFTYKKGETLNELIQLGSGFTSLADTTQALVYDETGRVQKVAYSDWKEFKINPNSHVVIGELDLSQKATAWIEGEIKIQGGFPIINNKTTLAELIELAGGLKTEALQKAAYILRNSTNAINYTEKTELDILLKRTSDQYAQGLKYLDIELGIGQDRLYIDLTDKTALSNTLLKDGDKLVIPKNTFTIVVFGQVNKPGLYGFNENKTLENYIENAGGIAIAGVKERIFVIKAGSKSWVKPQNTKLESGDMIFIDRKPYEDFVTSQQLEMSKASLTMSKWSIVISAISTTVLLISVLVK